MNGTSDEASRFTELLLSIHLPFKPLTRELNPSAQCYLTRFLLGILLLEPCISLIYARKTNKRNNYSLSLLIMYGSRDHHAPRHWTQHAHPQYSIDCSSIEHLSEALGTLPEDGNVILKHVGATIHN
jgi:disulfide bond formation protein DsbB